MEGEPRRIPEPARSEPVEPVTTVGVVRRDGPAAAAMLAAGIGSLVLAVLVVVAEAKESFKESLAYSDRVGPLSGKTIWAVVAFAVSWLVLGIVLRRRDVDLGKVAIITSVLLGLALIGTFSPFFEMFQPEE
jgi:hypothetical protein